MKNKEWESALPNIYKGITTHCKPDDIVLLVDGDDQLLGVNIMKVYNSLYITKKLEILYSNYLDFMTYSSVTRGISQPYSLEQKKQNKYRQIGYTHFFHARSFRASTFLKIKVADFKDNDGKFWTSASDYAYCIPLLELSCGRNMFVEEYFYLRNIGTGFNDDDTRRLLVQRITAQIKHNRTKYTC